VAIVLAHLGKDVSYRRIKNLLKTKSFGTPGHHLLHLTELGLQVLYREGSMEELKAHLAKGDPCIVLVRTKDLNYWNSATDHALVVVGFDERSIFVNDPAFDNHPIAVPLVNFELAWMAFDYRYSCLRVK
jgi:ABC-type bacteriocin/lantibiotic exporter with double-glycine peptidase domain